MLSEQKEGRRRPASRRLLARAHGLVGLLAALPLLLIALTGSALVFSEELLGFGQPKARGSGAPLDAEASAEALGSALAALEGHEISTLRLPRADFALARAWLVDGRQALVDVEEQRVVGLFSWYEHPASFLHELHVALTLGEPGAQLVGGLGLVALALLASGLVALWRRRGALSSLELWRPRSLRRGELTRVHGHWGLALTPLILLALLSGLGLSYHATARALLTSIAGGAAKAAAPPGLAACVDQGALVEPHAMSRVASARFPAAELAMVYPPRSPERPWGFRLRQPGEWHPNGRTMAWLDPCDARVVATEDALAAPLGERLVHAIYPLHAAHFPGPLDELLVFLTGLGLAAIVVLGALGRLRAPRPLGFGPGIAMRTRRGQTRRARADAEAPARTGRRQE